MLYTTKDFEDAICNCNCIPYVLDREDVKRVQCNVIDYEDRRSVGAV